MTFWNAKLSWMHHSSLLWRFLLIGLVSLSPLVGALIQFAGEEHETALRNIRRQADLLISQVIENHHQVIEQARSTLGLLASAPEVQSAGTECTLFLVRQLAFHKSMSALRYSRPNGEVLCGDTSHMEMVPGGESSYRTEAIREKRFIVDGLSVDPATGRLTMDAAMPVSKAGEIAGVLSATIRSTPFDHQAASRMSSTFDINMLIVDRSGILLGQFPPSRELVGTNLQDLPVVRKALDHRGGIAEAQDLEGRQRLFVFRDLPGTDAVLALGLEKESVSGSINQSLYYRLILIALIISGCFLLGALGAEVLIFRPLRNLAQTAGALAAGDSSARSPDESAGEVGILARSLNRMADAVADRESALKEAKNVAEKALNEARLANDAKTDFLASMSHEIRTPLHSILGYTARLLSERLTEPQRHYAELIQVAGSSLLTIANDVLDFSSLEADRTKLHTEPFSPAALVCDTVALVESGAGNQAVPITVALDEGLPHLLCGDQARLRQILLNLLNNAVKFTREGSIIIRAEHKGSRAGMEVIRISVADTGIGIPQDKFDRLFKRFSQVDPSISREFGGTGLGLAISKRLIELLGGKIGFESQEGEGSTFWIEVALLPGIERSLPRQDALPEVPPARILVAEDIEVNQELARFLLASEGHEVDVVSDGDLAVAALQEKRYDLVLMDIHMPGVDGLAATKRIRALPHPANQTIIVAMTANVLPQQVRTFKEAGMNDYIGKPVGRNELLRKLAEWLPASRDRNHIEPERDPASVSPMNTDALQGFLDVMGADQIKLWLERLDHQLSEGFAGALSQTADQEALVRNAHAVVSQAALLGFSRLAECCTLFERAFDAGEDLAAPLEEVRDAARDVRLAIAGMRVQDRAPGLSVSVRSQSDPLQGKQAVAARGMSF